MRSEPYYKKKKGRRRRGWLDEGVIKRGIPAWRSGNGGTARDLAGHDVDVVVVQCGTGEHCAVGVEGRADDRGGAVVMEETGVRLEGGEVCAVRVEGLDFVAVGAPRRPQLVVVRHGAESDRLLTR
jgi:hypothetical protein